MTQREPLHRHSGTVSGRVCGGCGAELPPRTRASGRPRKWCSDKCRKDTMYVRHCVDCGEKLSGSDGNGPNAPTRCVRCSAKANGEERKVWTPDAVATAIQAWVRLHGEPPAITTWSPYSARYIGKPDLALAEYTPQKAGEWPSAQAVIRAFGSWNAGIAAAGFTPRPAHHVRKKAA